MKSFLDGKKSASLPALNIPRVAQLRPIGNVPRAASASPAHTHSIEVVKEGDRIVRLVITCACGEKTEVDCIYPVSG